MNFHFRDFLHSKLSLKILDEVIKELRISSSEWPKAFPMFPFSFSLFLNVDRMSENVCTKKILALCVVRGGQT